MDSKIVQVVREMPAQLKSVWDGMFEQSEHALRSSVAVLRGSLGRLEDYLREVEREHLPAVQQMAAEQQPTPSPVLSGARGKVVSINRRRRRVRFPSGEFILQTLKAHPGGIRPADIARALAAAAPGQHNSTVSIVNTTLARLSALGQTKRLRPGIWGIGPAAIAPKSVPVQTAARGERNSHAKLTEADVREIRNLSASGASTGTLATRFGIRSKHVTDIIHRRKWRHVA